MEGYECGCKEGPAMTAIVRRGYFPSVMNNLWDNDLFNNFFSADTPALPAVNVAEKDKEFTIDVSIPGFKKDDVTIEIDKNFLKVSANTEATTDQKDSNDKIIRQEFRASSFERSFVLPENIDTANIVAKQENGVLMISLPKKVNAVEDTVKKISVQ